MDTSILLLSIRLLLGALWIVAGLSKLLGQKQFREDIGEYKLLSPELSDRVARILPVLELTLGGLLVLGVLSRAAATTSCVLLLIFALAMTQTIREGRQIRCHCFGELGRSSVSWIAVVRNLVLAGLAVTTAVFNNGDWSLESLWFSDAIPSPQPSIHEVFPIWFSVFGCLTIVHLGTTLYRVFHVSRGRRPDETMRV